jgi:hypothetical protein
MSQTFTPYDTLENAFRAWWLVVALMILGGLFGLLLSRLRAPLYEATAVISISIDYARSGDLEDYEADYVIGIAGDVIASSDVYAAVAAQAGLDSDQLKLNLFIERSYHTWTLRARHSSPEQAAMLANLWADQAMSELSAALEQSLLADRYARLVEQLQACLAQPEPAAALCRDVDQVRQQIAEVTAGESNARVLSRGIPAYTLFTLSRRAALPTRPVVFGQGQMVFSGALIGLLLAIWAVHVRLPKRLKERALRAE